MNRVLVIEDNADLAFGLRSNLELEGYEVIVATTGPAGLDAARQESPDLVVLDVMLPDMDGFEVLERLRKSKSDVPVLMLTARGEELDKVRGLRSGADDYVTKPFGLMELLARIEALLRRGKASAGGDVAGSGILHLADLEIDTAARTVSRDGRSIELAPKEFDLLVELLRHRGKTISRTDLMKAVWGHSAAIVSRTVDTHVAELRRKLNDNGDDHAFIATVRKAGYRVD